MRQIKNKLRLNQEWDIKVPFIINGLYVRYSVLSSRCFRSACTGVHTHYTHTIVPEKTNVSNMDEHGYRVL